VKNPLYFTKEMKRISYFIILFILTGIANGCANSDLEFYSAKPDFMTCFRKKIDDSRAQISIAIEGEENTSYIPFIYRSRKVHSPYSVKFVLTTERLLYDSVLISNATLKKEEGAIFTLMNEAPVSLSFSEKKYSGYSNKESFQAEYEFPQRIVLDQRNDAKMTIIANFSLVTNNSAEAYNVEADFYPIREKWTGSLLSTITN
jgi:hypothetical protein